MLLGKLGKLIMKCIRKGRQTRMDKLCSNEDDEREITPLDGKTGDEAIAITAVAVMCL